MILKQVLQDTGLSLKELTAIIGVGDIASLRKKAGFETQEAVVVAIKQAFKDNGIEERTMTAKSWGEYERGERSPSLSLKAWLIICDVLKCSPEELINALENSVLAQINKKN